MTSKHSGLLNSIIAESFKNKNTSWITMRLQHAHNKDKKGPASICVIRVHVLSIKGFASFQMGQKSGFSSYISMGECQMILSASLLKSIWNPFTFILIKSSFWWVNAKRFYLLLYSIALRTFFAINPYPHSCSDKQMVVLVQMLHQGNYYVRLHDFQELADRDAAWMLLWEIAHYSKLQRDSTLLKTAER